MPNTIPKPTDDAAAGKNGHRHPSLDFSGQRELDWGDIETTLHNLTAEARAVEILGREALDSIHGERMVAVFGLIAEGMQAHIRDLKDLLGLSREART